MTNILAIDPGKNGGLAYATSDFIEAIQMPLAGDEVDFHSIAQYLIQNSITLCCMEKVGAMPGQGVTSMFNFGQTYGGIKGVCAALGVRLELVTPQKWKSVVLAGTPKDKDAAINYCRRVFPDISLLASPRSRKPHDGISDALCILEYARRTYIPQVA